MNTHKSNEERPPLVDRLQAWVDEKYELRGHRTGELLREAIAHIATLTAERDAARRECRAWRAWEAFTTNIKATQGTNLPSDPLVPILIDLINARAANPMKEDA